MGLGFCWKTSNKQHAAYQYYFRLVCRNNLPSERKQSSRGLAWKTPGWEFFGLHRDSCKIPSLKVFSPQNVSALLNFHPHAARARFTDAVWPLTPVAIRHRLSRTFPLAAKATSKYEKLCLKLWYFPFNFLLFCKLYFVTLSLLIICGCICIYTFAC